MFLKIWHVAILASSTGKLLACVHIRKIAAALSFLVIWGKDLEQESLISRSGDFRLLLTTYATM